jgi:hypothetical protein
MSLLINKTLRTSSVAAEIFTDPRTETSSEQERFPFASATNGLVYYPLGDLLYSPVDDFCMKSLPVSRLGSLDGDSTPQFSVDDSDVVPFPVARSVSTAARENYTDDLSLDDDIISETNFVLPKMPLTRDPRGDDERTVKKLRIVKEMRPATPVCFEHLDIASLHLGEGGRQKLKSLLSATTKSDPELRERVSKIAKVKFASIPQLFQMAKVCGIWAEAVKIAHTYNTNATRLSISRAS